ncbi:MAG: hypothetical protein AB8G22_15390 [Saprospiraceae bacterium]
MSIEALKLKLIHKIYSLNNLAELERIEQSISTTENDKILKQLNRPMRKKLDLEQLKKEQNWQQTDAKEVFAIMDEINIEEPLSKLLKEI